jgi:hypothetical protein
MDFSDPDERKEPIPFTLDGPGSETFYATPVAPAGALQDMAAIGDLAREQKIPQMLAKLDGLLDMILLEESGARFKGRLRSPGQPVTQQKLMKIIRWLMEQYTGRPTEPASSSATGQVATGPSSTDGASPTESTSTVWDSVAPST